MKLIDKELVGNCVSETYYDDETDGLLFNHVMDAEPVLEMNAEDKKVFSGFGDGYLAARIPLPDWLEWRKLYGEDFYKDTKLFMKLLNEQSQFKTTDKRL